ncbi:MAG: hypothetical protein IJM69_06635 [Firmicutes bacterium]|nr:hypothetical protein [Bacillota bacterium]MCR4711146.1 hypothetical protein [Clostridia bacterium]
MSLLYDLSQKYKTLSIVGMAKNAGKTTALNYLIEEGDDEGIRLGITSTGRDGETVDLVTSTEKPRIYLYEDTLVSIPTQLYELAEAGLEILEMSRYRTPLGELLLCRVREAGYVQVAGPMATADTKRLCARMFDHGAELVLIDGAIDRKSIASPETSDAIILSTGAVLSRSLKTVVQETAHIVGLYNLPELEKGEARDLIEKAIADQKLMCLDRDPETGSLSAYQLDLATGLGAGRYINEEIGEKARYIYLPGALTKSVIADIDPAKFRRITFVLKDPTKIFIDALTWRQLLKRGFEVKVLKNIEVAAITVNPTAPAGYAFDSDALISEMRKSIPDLPVIDVRK